MKRISCSATRVLLESLGGAVDPTRLVEGLPYTLEHLQDARQTIDWDSFVRITERLEALVPPGEFVAIGRRLVRAPSHELLARMAGVLLSPRSLYVVGARWIWPQMFPHVLVALRDLEGGDVEFACDLLPGYRGSEAFFRFMIPSLAAMPTLLGLPPAEVGLDTDGRRAAYRIRPPRSATAASRLGRTARAILHAGTVSEELERRQADAQESWQRVLRTQQDFMLALERLPELVVIQQDGRYAWANPVTIECLGLPDLDALVGRPVVDLVHPEDHALLGERMSRTPRELSGAPPDAMRIVRPSGEVRIVEVTPPIEVEFQGRTARLVVGRDVTERRRLEERVHVSERLAALGTLAAGVAHEINNPLAYVRLHLAVAQRELAALGGGPDDDGDDHRRRLGEALATATEGIGRAAGIVRDLRVFSRAADDRVEACDPRAVIEATLALAGRPIDERARLLRDYRRAPAVLLNPGRLGQVLLNLVTNALDAMSEGDPAQHELRVALGTTPRGEAVIEIGDTGPGIPRDVLPRIFDLFFTTKPVGHGTGLGLAICHALVTGAGGELSVDTSSGKGTTFRLTLPPATDEAAAASPAAAGASAVRRPATRILVVDDEPAIVRGLVDLLAPLGEVAAVTSGRKALDLLVAREFDVILCDLMMADVDGVALHRQLARLRPGAERRIVFITGGVLTAETQRFLDGSDNPCVEKPFDLAQLEATIREVAARPA